MTPRSLRSLRYAASAIAIKANNNAKPAKPPSTAPTIPPADNPPPPRLELPIVSGPMEPEDVDAGAEAAKGSTEDVVGMAVGVDMKAEPRAEAAAAEASEADASEAREAAEREESTLAIEGSRAAVVVALSVAVCCTWIRIVTMLLAPETVDWPPLAVPVREGEMVCVVVPGRPPVRVE